MKKLKPHFVPLPCKVPGAYISICRCGAIIRHKHFTQCIDIAIRHMRENAPKPEDPR